MKARFDDLPEPPEEPSVIDEPIDPDREFWQRSDELERIHAVARHRRASPYAVLGCVARRAVASVGPHVVLPPITGGVASLNFFTASAGVSGQGKGVADAAGNAAVFFHDALAESLDAARPSIGSGEGLARLFAGSRDEPGLTRAHLVVPEVKTLEALMGRQGSTLVGELLKAYMGEQIGFRNAQKATTTEVAEHTYRLCLGVGVQPENAGFFLSREKDGWPQRFFWLPTDDPWAPVKRPPPAAPLHVQVPEFPVNADDERHVLQIPAAIEDEVDAYRQRVLVRDPNVNPLDGHLVLTRLKLAFALAVLHGKTSIDEGLWKIAGDLIVMSTNVRDQLRETVAASHRRQNAAKGRDQAERAQIVGDRLADQAQKRVVKAICSKLRRDGRATRSELRLACAASIRPEFEPVFEMMLDQHVIVPSGLPQDRFATEYEFGADYDGGLS